MTDILRATMDACDKVNEMVKGKMSVYLTASYQPLGADNQLCIKMVMFKSGRVEVRETKVDAELLALGADALYKMVEALFKKFVEGQTKAPVIGMTINVDGAKEEDAPADATDFSKMVELMPKLRDIDTGLFIPDTEVTDWKIIEESAMILGKLFTSRFRNIKTNQIRQIQVLPPKDLEI